MPRKKAADRVGPVKTRSRGGCKECRASRVRCDTKKPTCTRCLEKGLDCTTQLVLKWESEFVSRGLAFGRAGVWSKARATGGPSPKPSPGASPSIFIDDQEWCPVPLIESWGFVNSGVATFDQPYEVDVACDELNALIVRDKGYHHFPRYVSETSLDSPLSMNVLDASFIHPEPDGLSPSLSLFPPMSASEDRFLFDYYLQQVCPRTTASSKLSSPFASIILPFCLSASPLMFTAIQALGACHWSRFDSTYSVIGLRLKAQALRGLRHRLATEGPVICSEDPEMLAIMMMLCLYEIVDNCDQRWTIHLKGAKDLIRLRRQRQNSSLAKSRDALDPVSAFAELFFAFQDVMGRTACGRNPELVSILSSITEMSRTRRSLTTHAARASFSQRAASLVRKLENLVQEVNDDDDSNLESAAELKRLAAVLYLHCALYGASPSTPLVVGYVRKILRLVSDLLDSGSLVSMTWPVFVAAVELDPGQDEVWRDNRGETVVHGRPLVLRALAAMAESSVSNVARTRAVIVKVWQARDSDMVKGSPVDASDDMQGCNDWEWYVAPISNAMSLA